jgi:segregation and condensation protein B
MSEVGQAIIFPFTKTDNPQDQLHLHEALRMAEAILFASAEPVSEKALSERLPENTNIPALMLALQKNYGQRGINLVHVDDCWAFRTAADLSFLMSREAVSQKKLSRAALEVLAIIAYHQPVTRAEMEEIRGVETAKGTLDVLMETGWVKIRGRRKVPGRPVTYGTTLDFLDHFGLQEVRDLPGIDELKGAGLLSPRMPSNFVIPQPPVNNDELQEDEDPLTDIDLEELGLLTPRGGDD